MSELPTQIQPLSQPVDIPDPVATFSPEVEAEIDRHLAKYPVMRSAILPLMFIVQRERGYLDPAGVAPDGKFTVSLVECLGSCGTAPMFQVNFDYHENLTPAKVDQILDSLP